MPFLPPAMALLGAEMMVESTGAVQNGAGSAIGGALGFDDTAKQQIKAIQAQTDTATRLAEETRAEKIKLEADAKKNAAQLAAASGIAAEEARKEDMRRRSKQTKTLLTGSTGDVSATGMGKTLLGG